VTGTTCKWWNSGLRVAGGGRRDTSQSRPCIAGDFRGPFVDRTVFPLFGEIGVAKFPKK
jgi:hypothetical protein